MRLTPLVGDSVAAYIERKELYKIPFASCALALEKQSRKEHSLRVASVAAKRAVELGIDEKRAIAAALFHDCAKNLKKEDALLEGFVLAPEWGNVPDAVFHQFAGAYLAEKKFGVTDSEVLDAIRYHTSGRARMGELEKLIFLADMVESGRDFKGVETIRELFFEHSQKGVGALDACLKEALSQTVEFLKEKGAEIYPLTIEAYKFYAKQEAIYGGNDK